MAAPSGKIQNFPEIDRVAYFGVAKARRKILPGQRAFIDELISTSERQMADDK